MTIDRNVLSDQLIAYLSRELPLAELIDWAERSFVDDELVPDKDVVLLNDILMYIAAADTAQFPLTWDRCVEFLDRLGTTVTVVRAAG